MTPLPVAVRVPKEAGSRVFAFGDGSLPSRRLGALPALLRLEALQAPHPAPLRLSDTGWSGRCSTLCLLAIPSPSPGGHLPSSRASLQLSTREHPGERRLGPWDLNSSHFHGSTVMQSGMCVHAARLWPRGSSCTLFICWRVQFARSSDVSFSMQPWLPRLRCELVR